ncbi:MAG: sporulation transcriptional regulator SpoIIID [Clostridia bacterium]|nr:sporulation transcriptional regulator SpoIIID [Clostridia bacterium]
MKDYIEQRVLEIANHIIRTNSTVREAAKLFKVSKSTVHKDVAERLPKINPLMYTEVKKVLEKNKAERHIRGGKATRLKYKMKKCKIINKKEDF